MRIPRRERLSKCTPQCFHIVTRCVRRTYLCGFDEHTGRNYDHRKQWLERRLLALADIFAVAIHAYAVMSNHLHLCVYIDPREPARWSDESVARRWLGLSANPPQDGEQWRVHTQALLSQPARLAQLRERLGSLSWFMRYLKEPLARQSNREDQCTGHFWEGRFHLLDALDDEAVLSQMVYVDLNPMRAGLARRPEQGPHTSAARRVATRPEHAPLSPIAGCVQAGLPCLSEAEYRALLHWSAGTLSAPGAAASHPEPPAVLARLNISPTRWSRQVAATETHYRRAVGSVAALLQLAQDLGQRWVRGIGFARSLEKLPGEL